MKLAFTLAVWALLAQVAAGAAPGEDCHRLTDRFEARGCFFELAQAGEASRVAVERFVTGELEERPRDPFYWLIQGDLRYQNRELTAAAQCYRTALAGFAGAGALDLEIAARRALSRALLERGSFEESIAEAVGAVERAEKSGDRLLVQDARQTLLERYQGTGRFAQSIAVIERWFAESTESSTPEQRYSFLRTAGNIAVSCGRFDLAKRLFEKLAELAREVDRKDWEAQALYGSYRITTEKASDNPSPEAIAQSQRLAEQALEAALEAEPSDERDEIAGHAHWALGMRSKNGEADSHFEQCLGFAGDAKAESYCLTGWSRVLAREGRAEMSWQRANKALERANSVGGGVEAKTQAWRELMHASWALGSSPRAVTDSEAALGEIEKLRRLQGDSDLRADLFATWSDDYLWLSGRILETERSDLLPTAFEVTERMRARALLDVLSARGTASAETFATLEEVRAALAPDQALLSFQIAPWTDWAGDFGGGSWLLVVTPEAAPRVIRLRRDRMFWRRAVRTFVGLTAGRDGREEESAAALYDDLLGPALTGLPAGIRRLVLVPDDVLHKLPFELLRPAPGEMPFGERFEVSRVPSATLWRHWRETVAEAPAMPGWVVADPSPLPPGPGGQPLPALPYAAVEGRETARSLGVSSRLEVATAALEADFLRQRPALAGVLHFGTHAVADEDHPERSAIFLGAGAGEDGRLEPDEIVASPVAGRLVVLSSCESAAGLLLRGEGVLSLARAFFEGRRTRAVVASLWPLRDDDAQAFFARFYRHLTRGDTVAGAVREVRGELRTAGYPAEAWAGVVVLGDGDLVPNPPRRKTTGGTLAPGLGALMGLGAAWWNRRRAA